MDETAQNRLALSIRACRTARNIEDWSGFAKTLLKHSEVTRNICQGELLLIQFSTRKKEVRLFCEKCNKDILLELKTKKKVRVT